MRRAPPPRRSPARLEQLALYRRAAAGCPGLSWTVLAAIGSIESAHGRSNAPGVTSGANFAGAMGPMQFLGSTWAEYGVDGDADGAVDVYNRSDAVFGAARYLCAGGAGRLARLGSAIWDYNHADWYVEDVLALAARYGAGGFESAFASGNVAELVNHPNLILTPEARGDILSGGTDPRLIALLAASASKHRIAVSVIRTGHDQFVRGTERVSNHYLGRGVDIVEVDGMAVSASNDAALDLALLILTSDAALRPGEFGSPWPELAQFPGGFADDDHRGHLHLGWSA